MSREKADGGNNNGRDSGEQSENRDSSSSKSASEYVITISGPGFFQLFPRSAVLRDQIDDLFTSTPPDLQRLYAEILEIGKDDPAEAIGVLLRSLSLRNREGIDREPTKEYHNAGRSAHPAHDIASIVGNYINSSRYLEGGDTGGAILSLDSLISWVEEEKSKGGIEVPYAHTKKVHGVQNHDNVNEVLQQGLYVYKTDSGDTVYEAMHVYSVHNPQDRSWSSAIETKVVIVTKDGKRFDLGKILPKGTALASGVFMKLTNNNLLFDLDKYIPHTGNAEPGDYSSHVSADSGIAYTGYSDLKKNGAILAFFHEAAHAWNQAYGIESGAKRDHVLGLLEQQITAMLTLKDLEGVNINTFGGQIVDTDADDPLCKQEDVLVFRICDQHNPTANRVVCIKGMTEVKDLLQHRINEELAANVAAMRAMRFLRMSEIVNVGTEVESQGGLGVRLESALSDEEALRQTLDALGTYNDMAGNLMPSGGFKRERGAA